MSLENTPLTTLSAGQTGLINSLAIPTTNATTNTEIGQVIGSKADDVTNLISGNNNQASIYAMLLNLQQHMQSTMSVYPERASSITLTKGVGAWAAYPTAVQIIPASTIASPFDIHSIIVD